MAIAAAKIASFDAMAAAGVPAVGALDLRHPDPEMAIPARATLLSRRGMFGAPEPGPEPPLALPPRHGDADPVRPARRLHAADGRPHVEKGKRMSAPNAPRCPHPHNT